MQNPSDVILMIPTMFILGIPMLFILTKHQQKMALIAQARIQGKSSRELEDQIAGLRQLICDQSLAIDNVARAVSDIKQPALAQNEAPRLDSLRAR